MHQETTTPILDGAAGMLQQGTVVGDLWPPTHRTRLGTRSVRINLGHDLSTTPALAGVFLQKSEFRQEVVDLMGIIDVLELFFVIESDAVRSC
jgi:hypothetical protein